MINNLIIKKKLVQLGLTSLALVNGAVSLGCGRVVEASEEEIKQIISVVEAESTELATNTPEITVTPSTTPTCTPSPTPTEAPTNTPSPTPYDPYTLTDEEAIEIGNYVYDNYIKNYITVEGSFFQRYADEYAREDLINLVCLFNQKYPALYPDRRTACSNGDLQRLITFFEDIINVNDCVARDTRKTSIFPYSVFLKEGRPEKELLEEMEGSFRHISEDKVSNEEIYGHWDKMFKLAMNYDETFKEWDSFNTVMFYYMAEGQYYYFLECPEVFNGLSCYVPSQYVFYNRKGTNLYLKDAFVYSSSTTKQKYAALTNDEYQAYRGCFDKVLEKFNGKNIDGDNYIKQRRKNGN